MRHVSYTGSCVLFCQVEIDWTWKLSGMLERKTWRTSKKAVGGWQRSSHNLKKCNYCRLPKLSFCFQGEQSCTHLCYLWVFNIYNVARVFALSNSYLATMVYLTMIILGLAGYEMMNMIISYPASPSRIIVLLKTLRPQIENLNQKQTKERNVEKEKTVK